MEPSELSKQIGYMIGYGTVGSMVDSMMEIAEELRDLTLLQHLVAASDICFERIKISEAETHRLLGA